MAKAEKAAGGKSAAKSAPKPAKQGRSDKPNFFSRTGRYFGDVRSEMKRVVWPTRQEVVNSSGIVITTLIIFMVLILVFDQVSAQIMYLIGKI